MGGYDLGDVVGHMWSELQREGYRGVPIDSFVVDETQDMTQAELRLLLHVAEDKNDLMLAGDSAQTIASGVSFRSFAAHSCRLQACFRI